MTDFIHDFLIYPFLDTSDYLLMSLGVFFWIVVIGILSAIAYYILYLIDSVGLVDNVGLSMITDKEFIPEHTETTLMYNAATSTHTHITSTYSDEWYLTFKISGLFDKKQVTEYDFNKYSTGDVVEVMYSRGRLWKTVYVTTF